MEGSWDFYHKALHTLKNLEHLENDGGQPGQALVNHTCRHLLSQDCILQTRKQAQSGSVLLQGCAAHSRHPGSWSQPPPNLSTGGAQPASISTYRRMSAGIPQSCRSSWPRPFWPLTSPSGIPPKEQSCSCAQRYRTGRRKAHGRQIQGETRVPPSTTLSAGATESDSVSIQTLDHSGECPPAVTGTASEQEKGLHRQQRGMELAPRAGGRLEQGPGPSFVLAHQRDKSGLCVTEVLVSVTNCTFNFRAPQAALSPKTASFCIAVPELSFPSGSQT